MRPASAIALACLVGLTSCDSTGPDLDLPTGLSKLTVDDQLVQVGEPVTLSLSVRDSRDRPVEGVSVLWDATTGGGTVEPRSVPTGQDGVASATLLAGRGENTIVARIQGTELSTVFRTQGCSPCGQWSVASFLPRGRAWAGAEVIAGRIWVIGGVVAGQDGRPASTTSIDVFEPATGTWLRPTELPRSLSAPTVAAVQGKIYVMGGLLPEDWAWPGQRGVIAFDPATSAWTDKAPLPVGRILAPAAVLDGKIYVAGGYSYCDSFDGWCTGPLANLDIYDPLADRWTSGPPMSQARAAAGAAVLDGKLYLVGGDRGDMLYTRSPITSVEMFDPTTNRWISKAPLPTAGYVQVVATNGRLYAFMSGLRPRVYEYDPATDAWMRMRDAPAHIFSPAVAAVDGRLYVIGGQPDESMYLAPISADVYVMQR